MTDTILDMIVKDSAKYHIEQDLDIPKMWDLMDLEDYRTLIILVCNPAPQDSRKPIYWFDAIIRVADLIEKLKSGKMSIESADMSARDWRNWLVEVFYYLEEHFHTLAKPEYFEDYAKVVIAHYSLLSVCKYGELDFKYVK
jgi:hypothetical protein